MRPTIIIWLLIFGFVLFSVFTSIMWTMGHTTAWTGMCNDDWEYGLVMVVFPGAMLLFAFALIGAVYRGKDDKRWSGRGGPTM